MKNRHMKNRPSVSSGMFIAFAAATSLPLVGAGCADDHSHAASETTLVITVSGEETARDGYAFPPAGTDAVALADGWELTFDHLIVSIGEVTLSETPDLSPTDQSKTGAVVARARPMGDRPRKEGRGHRPTARGDLASYDARCCAGDGTGECCR